MWIADEWKDYALLDTSKGEKLEKWGDYTLIRPDPQVIWESGKSHPAWRGADASYKRIGGGGSWRINSLPESWNIRYKDLTFKIAPSGFKHTGLFPEQAANWDWFGELIKNAGRPIKVLNLFAYTGGATVAAAKAGASVVHVDSSKGMVARAKENAQLSGVADAPIRYIVDDCKKFVEREIRRANKYDAVIMDPPSYGRGPNGEVWKLEDNIDSLVALISNIISDEPLFFLLNSYTTGLSPLAMRYIVELRLPSQNRRIDAQELGLRTQIGSHILPCGSSVRVTYQ